jgi:ketosteroid isomerase-like protein
MAEIVSDLSSSARALPEVAAVAARFAEVWAQPRLDAFIELLHPEVVLHQPITPPIVGRDAARREFERLFRLLPDLCGTVDHWAADGDFLLIAWRLRATWGWSAPYEWPIADHIRVRDGLIIERRALFDSVGLFGAMLRGGPAAWVAYARYRGYLPGERIS